MNDEIKLADGTRVFFVAGNGWYFQAAGDSYTYGAFATSEEAIATYRGDEDAPATATETIYADGDCITVPVVRLSESEIAARNAADAAYDEHREKMAKIMGY